MGLKPRSAGGSAAPPANRYHQINSSPRARRAIARLANDNGVDARLVEIAARLTWDFDPVSRNESKGWVTLDEELLAQAADDLEVAGAMLRFPAGRRLTRDRAAAAVLARLDAADPDALVAGFIRGAAEHDAGRVSEFATAHYLRGATAARLAVLRWGGDLALGGVMRELFVKLFRAGSMDRDNLAYAYTDLALDVSAHRGRPPVTSWLPALADRIQALGPASTLTQLLACTKGLVAGGKYFKQTVLEALAFARVLRVAGVGDELFLPDHRDDLSKHFHANEWRFPLRLWAERGGQVDRRRLEALGG